MTIKKTKQETLNAVNAKKAAKEADKAQKEMQAKIDFSANNAERAFVLMDEMKYEETSLFDAIFAEKNSESAINGEALDALSEDRKKEFFALTAEASKMASSKNTDGLGTASAEIMSKFPELVDMSKAMSSSKDQAKKDFLILKILRLSGEQTWELAKLYSKDEIPNFMEAVEQAKFYLMFLKGM